MGGQLSGETDLCELLVVLEDVLHPRDKVLEAESLCTTVHTGQ